MKHALTILPTILLAAPALAQPAEEASAEDIAGVRAALEAYIAAGDTGNPDSASQAFETEEGVLFIRRPAGEEQGDHVTTMELGELASRYTRANGDRNAVIRDIRIVEGVMASAHVYMRWGDTELDDMFLLYKLGDEWKIVAKTAVFH
ncbi:MAG: nuclear transport factor 2 family protein [Alphaproteobacteria bacterium]|nr:nuclear transport factor 2 family protein [Alphaproteobacteria bacterium]